MMAAILVGLGGFFGAISRFALSKWINGRVPTFPLGTLFINALGSFLLGWMTGAGIAEQGRLLLGVGFMGAFTTFSTLKWESLQMAQKNEWGKFLLYLGCSYTFGVLLAFLGHVWGAGRF
jgi:CrcB protein